MFKLKITIAALFALLLLGIFGCGRNITATASASQDNEIIIKFNRPISPMDILFTELPPNDAANLWLLQCEKAIPSTSKCNSSIDHLVYGKAPESYKQLGAIKPLIKGKEYQCIISSSPTSLHPPIYAKFGVK
jgi:hypothetical protein